MATLTVYPNANTESVSVDGMVRGTNSNHTAARDAATGDLADDTSAEGLPGCADVQSTDFYISRAFFLFDTSSLAALGIISAATLSVYGTAKTSTGDTANIYSSSPASNTALVTADYDQVGTTALATGITVASWSTSGYNDFALNATGIAAISKTGISKFSMRLGGDVNDAFSGNDLRFYFADQTGTSSDPKLTITYTDTVSNINIVNSKIKNSPIGVTLTDVGTVNISNSVITDTSTIGVVVGSNCGYTRITHNFFRNSGGGAISDAGTGTVDQDNTKL